MKFERLHICLECDEFQQGRAMDLSPIAIINQLQDALCQTDVEVALRLPQIAVVGR